MHPPNARAVEMLEGTSSTSGAILSGWKWSGSVRVWFHGERTVPRAEGERLVEAYRTASTEEEREEALDAMYRGIVVTQASSVWLCSSHTR